MRRLGSLTADTPLPLPRDSSCPELSKLVALVEAPENNISADQDQESVVEGVLRNVSRHEEGEGEGLFVEVGLVDTGSQPVSSAVLPA